MTSGVNPNSVMLNLGFGLVVGDWMHKHAAGEHIGAVLVVATAFVVAACLGFVRQEFDRRRSRRRFREAVAKRRDSIIYVPDDGGPS